MRVLPRVRPFDIRYARRRVSTIDLSPGSLFAGQFRIVRPLARGGMGAVYVVEQLTTGRERALKLMHPMLVADAKSVERFEREAQVGSRMESDHVVEVIAAGVESVGPTPWICMELLKGETLADRLERRGTPPPQELLEIVQQLGHALVAAHKAGIVHRDLKPENIFLAESRREGVPFTLKVLDFGVATLTHEHEGGVSKAKTTQAVGSPLWMAPEQTNVGTVTAATDVWALGLILFQLLSGQSYWRCARREGSTITALLVEIMIEPLEPASVRAAEVAPGVVLPAGFDEWFARCVVRDPLERFADAQAALPALRGVLSAGRGAVRSEGGVPWAAAALPSTTPVVLAPVAFEVTQPGPAITAHPALAAPQIAPPSSGLVSAPATTPMTQGAAHDARTTRGPWRGLFFLAVGVGATALAAFVALVFYVTRASNTVGSQGTIELTHPTSDQTGRLHNGGAGVRIASSDGTTVELGYEGGDLHAHAQRPALTPPGAVMQPVAAPEAEAPTPAPQELDAPPAPLAVAPPPTPPPAPPTPHASPRAPRSPRAATPAGPPRATAEQLAAFEARVVRMCRTNLDGQPRTRFTIVVDGAIRVTPTTNDPQNWFARCVRMNAAESRQPTGTYVVHAP